MDARLQRMAEVLVTYSLAVQPKDWVVIESPILGEPLARACVEAVLAAGGNPTVVFRSEDIAEAEFRSASDDQLAFVSPASRLMIEQANARMSILAPRNTRALAGVDPTKMGIVQKAMEPLSEAFMRRSASGDLRWTVCVYPTQAAAQDASMSLRDYEDFVYAAGLLDDADPVAAWKREGARQLELIDWISRRQSIHVTAPGTDLTLSVAGRTWLTDEGTKNFPGGEFFTGPIEDSANGVVEFTFPAFLGGREVQGVRLVFKDGVVTEATARGDEAYLRQMLAVDDGARRLGEFAFGTNAGIQRFTKNTLFDEKIGGTLHMALGRSYPETGGRNESAIHWDMVCDLRTDSEVTVDGDLFIKDGEFCV